MKFIQSIIPAMALWFATGNALADAGHEHDHHHGSEMPSGHWMAPEEAARRPNPVGADSASLARGKELFEKNCVSCHGSAGRGDGPVGAALSPKPANLAVMAPQHSAGDLAWKIAHGRGAMPAWKDALKDRQIWDVVNYLQKDLSTAGN